MVKWLKWLGATIVLIFIAILTSKNSGLRKKAARSKAVAEKEKHQATVSRVKGAISSIENRIEMAEQDKKENAGEIEVLKQDHEKYKKALDNSVKKIEKNNNEIMGFEEALKYAENLKNER